MASRCRGRSATRANALTEVVNKDREKLQSQSPEVKEKAPKAKVAAPTIVQDIVEPLHPTVAISDLFMALCAFYSTRMMNLNGFKFLFVHGTPYLQKIEYLPGMELMHNGFSWFGIACSFGVLRFGISPETFRPFNEIFAKVAGQVGVPLLGYGVSNCYSLKKSIHFPETDPTFFLFFMLCISLQCGKEHNVLYTTVCGALSMLSILCTGYLEESSFLMGGAALFMFGGLAIGAEREKCLFGVRRENLFHYCLGTALLLIAFGVKERYDSLGSFESEGGSEGHKKRFSEEFVANIEW
jgi:hypothetical protein